LSFVNLVVPFRHQEFDARGNDADAERSSEVEKKVIELIEQGGHRAWSGERSERCS
jgi:hypothetical protein